MSDNIPRQPAGSPQGGQFAATGHAEADVDLGATAPRKDEHQWDRPLDFHHGTARVNDPHIAYGPTDEYMRSVTVSFAPNPVVAAQGGALAAVLSDRHDHEALPEKGSTLVRLKDGNLTLYEGRMRAAGDRLVFAPKGGRSEVVLRADAKVVCSRGGYGHSEDLMADVRATPVPDLVPADVEGLPDDEDETDRIEAVYVMNHPGFKGYPESIGPGSVFAATSITPDGDDPIINGYYVAPKGTSLESESGSFRLSDMQKMGARVRDYEPGDLTYKDVIHTDGSGELIRRLTE